MILSESTSHSSDGPVPSLVVGGVLHQKAIEVGLDDHSWIGVSINADSRAYAVAAYVEHTSVRGKVSCCRECFLLLRLDLREERPIK